MPDMRIVNYARWAIQRGINTPNYTIPLKTASVIVGLDDIRESGDRTLQDLYNMALSVMALYNLPVRRFTIIKVSDYPSIPLEGMAFDNYRFDGILRYTRLLCGIELFNANTILKRVTNSNTGLTPAEQRLGFPQPLVQCRLSKLQTELIHILTDAASSVSGLCGVKYA